MKKIEQVATDRVRIMEVARRLEGIAMLVETSEAYKPLSGDIQEQVERLRRGMRGQQPRNAA